MESIIVAVITGVIAAAASIYSAQLANEKTVAVLNAQMKNQSAQIERLEKALEAYQNENRDIRERLVRVERDLNTAFVRIDELKEAVKK